MEDTPHITGVDDWNAEKIHFGSKTAENVDEYTQPEEQQEAIYNNAQEEEPTAHDMDVINKWMWQIWTQI